MEAKSDFSIDPRNKLGGDVDWVDSDDFATFVDTLNRGVAVRGDGVPSETDLPRENVLDAATLAELKSLIAGYR